MHTPTIHHVPLIVTRLTYSRCAYDSTSGMLAGVGVHGEDGMRGSGSGVSRWANGMVVSVRLFGATSRCLPR